MVCGKRFGGQVKIINPRFPCARRKGPRHFVKEDGGSSEPSQERKTPGPQLWLIILTPLPRRPQGLRTDVLEVLELS